MEELRATQSQHKQVTNSHGRHTIGYRD